MFEQRLVLLPDAVEGGPARPSVRQWVFPDPASAGELVEVLAGVCAAVHGLHHLAGHCDAGLRQTKTTAAVCQQTSQYLGREAGKRGGRKEGTLNKVELRKGRDGLG